MSPCHLDRVSKMQCTQVMREAILIGFNQNTDEKEIIIVKIRLTDKTMGDLTL